MAVAEKQGLDIGSLLSGVSGVANLLTGTNSTTKTSGGTTKRTTGLDITQAGRKKMVQDLLSSVNGLASVAGGQRASGLYDSSTNQLLVNDLIDRTTSQVDRDTAKTVETTTTPGTTTSTVAAPRVGMGTAALAAGGAYGAKKLYDILSSGSSASTFAGALSDPSIVGSLASATAPISDFLSFTGDNSLMSGAANLGGVDFLSATGGMPVISAGMDLLQGDVSGAAGDVAGYMLGNMIAPGAGGPMGAMVSNILPVDSIVSGVGGFLKNIVGGSVICSELLAQGKMPKNLYILDVAYAELCIDYDVLEGYRLWAVPAVRSMRKSSVVTNLVAPFAISRAHYISALCGGDYSRKMAVLGWAVNAAGYPICWALGKLRKIFKKAAQDSLGLLTNSR